MRTLLCLFLSVIVCQSGKDGGDESITEIVNKKAKVIKEKIDWNGRKLRPNKERIYGWGLDKSTPALRISDTDRKKPARDRPEYVGWRKRFGRKRTYRNSSVVELHARIFEQTEEMVSENQAAFANGEVTYELGLNEFSDYTEEEYSQMMMSEEAVKAHSEFFEETNATTLLFNQTRLKRASIPIRSDYTSWLTPIKNQGGCGSCYSFSAIATVEALYFRKNQKKINFSEQFMVDCTSNQKSPFENGGCSGGWMWRIFYFLTERGARIESNYPYKGILGSCPNADSNEIFKIGTYVKIWQGDEAGLLSALVTNGPVAVAMDATRLTTAYRSGILDYPECKTNSPTHAVTVVGHGVENGKDFFLVRNSWGTNWGENGYFRIRRGVNMCGIANWASYPVL